MSESSYLLVIQRDFHLEFGANLFDCSHSGGILRQIRRRNAAPLPERRHQWGGWGGDRARAGKKIGLAGDRDQKKKIWGIRMYGLGVHKTTTVMGSLEMSSDSLREGLNGKKTFSFGHCQNHLTPPRPQFGQLGPFFWTSKFKIWKSV